MIEKYTIGSMGATVDYAIYSDAQAIEEERDDYKAANKAIREELICRTNDIDRLKDANRELENQIVQVQAIYEGISDILRDGATSDFMMSFGIVSQVADLVSEVSLKQRCIDEGKRNAKEEIDTLKAENEALKEYRLTESRRRAELYALRCEDKRILTVMVDTLKAELAEKEKEIVRLRENNLAFIDTIERMTSELEIQTEITVVKSNLAERYNAELAVARKALQKIVEQTRNEGNTDMPYSLIKAVYKHANAALAGDSPEDDLTKAIDKIGGPF